MKRGMLLGWIVLGMVFSSASCSPKPSAESLDQERLFKLKIPRQNSATEFIIAEELGYLAEEGIQLEEVGVLHAGEDIAATLNGSNHVFSGHPPALARAIQNGIKVKAVITGMVDHPEMVHMGYYVRKDGPIQRPEDFLKRKVKVAVSGLHSCTDLLVYEWLRQNNIPREQVEFVIMPDQQQEQALTQGLVELIVLHPPWIKKASFNDRLRLLFTSWEVVKTPAGGTSIRGFSEKFIQDHPEIVRGFVRAVVRAHQWINANTEEAIRIYARRLAMDPKNISLFYFDDHQYIVDSYIQTWLELMVIHGELEEGAIQAADLYTNAYNPYYPSAQP